MLLLLASLFVAATAQASWDAALHLHDAATVSRFDARCLDGSPSGFYYRPASSPNAATKWKFHFQGGGWATDPSSLLSRSRGQLGSSQSWTPWLSDNLQPPAAFYGLMSNHSAVASDFHFVWFGYCDGTSQLSDRVEPLVVNGKPVHLRGRAILDAHMYELERLHSFLSTATEVILSGTSAGGLSTYLHSSFIKSQLRVPTARIVAVPDAGWWWDTVAFNSTTSHPWVDSFAPAITPSLWNATLRGSGARCLADHAASGDQVRCFTQPYAYAYSDVPHFIVQSSVDTANLGYCFHMPCHLDGNSGAGSCSPSEVAAIVAFSSRLTQSIVTAQAAFSTRGDAHFITSCNQHEETCQAADWFGVTIAQSTIYIASGTSCDTAHLPTSDRAGSRRTCRK